nr:hypothetical protein BaRGS_032509 [Batillaria attramentaria]
MLSCVLTKDLYVRLIGGSNAYEGTVEVYFNGQWGAICDDVSNEDNIIFLLDTGLGGLIFRMNLLTQSFTPVPMNPLYAPSAMDYDPEYGRLYFSDPRLRQIVSVRFDGTDAREVRQLNIDAVLEKVEVDPLNRKLFYADTGNNVIAMMNLDGTGYQVIANSSLDEPRDIALDPRNQ